MSTLDRCAIEGCGEIANVVFTSLAVHNGRPLACCIAHAHMIREQGIAGAMADPEVRAKLGLPANEEEVVDGQGE